MRICWDIIQEITVTTYDAETDSLPESEVYCQVDLCCCASGGEFAEKAKTKKRFSVTPANFAGIMREAHLCQQVIKSLEAAFSSKGQSSVLTYQELSPSKTHSLCLSQGQRGIRKTYISIAVTWACMHTHWNTNAPGEVAQETSVPPGVSIVALASSSSDALSCCWMTSKSRTSGHLLHQWIA